MRRLFGLLLAGTIMLLPALSQNHGTAHAQDALTFNGNMALLSIAIKPGQTAQFEQIMAKVREALTTSSNPQRKQQAAGWKVFKSATAMPDGNIVYTHVINPVVRGTDYTIMAILYEAFTDPSEQTALFETYRDAFGANLGGSAGTVAVDLSRP